VGPFCTNLKPWSLLILFSGIVFAQPERPIRRPVNNELALETIAAPVRLEVPDAVQGVTTRLVFHVSPLSGKGLLSQQVRDALKALDKANGDAVFLKLRAFVAGTGDVRRIQSIVTEEFSGKKWPLPAITTVLVGALPLDNAQVVIEAISEHKKNAVNPAGLVFISAQPSVAELEKAMQAAGAAAVRVNCFADSLAQAEAARTASAKAFPGAAGTFVQLTRTGIGGRVSCEGVGRLPGRSVATGAPLIERLDLPGQEARADRSVAVLVRVPKLAFTGAQMAFAEQESGIQQAYERLMRGVQSLGVTPSEVLFANRYSVVGVAESTVPAPLENRPGRTGLVIEGLPAQDASVALEIVAAVQ
jgi:enamine deaminase RidA (YjgF/YER057c/UK114 family)